MWKYDHTDELCHYGVKGMRWGQKKRQLISKGASEAKIKSEKEKYKKEKRQFTKDVINYGMWDRLTVPGGKTFGKAGMVGKGKDYVDNVVKTSRTVKVSIIAGAASVIVGKKLVDKYRNRVGRTIFVQGY